MEDLMYCPQDLAHFNENGAMMYKGDDLIYSEGQTQQNIGHLNTPIGGLVIEAQASNGLHNSHFWQQQ